MKTLVDKNNRRDFLKICGLSTAPFLLPTIGLNEMSWSLDLKKNPEVAVNFIYDGLDLSPRQYLEKLTELDKTERLEPDLYGNGGPTKQLEETFAKITIGVAVAIEEADDETPVIVGPLPSIKRVLVAE